MKIVVLAFGTRPEATKMALVYHALRRIEGLVPKVLLSGQHREQLQQALELFEVPIEVNLEVMTDRQELTELAGRLLPQAAQALRRLQADYVLVHGDTLTTFTLAWASFLLRIPVGHVEAGLRSHNLAEPFPEEANRRLTDLLTDLDFAPTWLAWENLRREGKPVERILVTGQTGIDHILYAARRPIDLRERGLPPGPYVTITMHRRENWGKLGALAQVLARVATEHPEFRFVYPVHLNPVVREAVWPILGGLDNVTLTDPLDYAAMASLLARSELIVTDSGGLQEEGAALSVPVVVLRNVTERPEGLEAGSLLLAGTEPDQVYQILSRLLGDPSQRAQMRKAKNPYGDGRAVERVAQGVAWRLGLAPRPEDWRPQASSSSR